MACCDHPPKDYKPKGIGRAGNTRVIDTYWLANLTVQAVIFAPLEILNLQHSKARDAKLLALDWLFMLYPHSLVVLSYSGLAGCASSYTRSGPLLLATKICCPPIVG